jgi:hypothetical protein
MGNSLCCSRDGISSLVAVGSRHVFRAKDKLIFTVHPLAEGIGLRVSLHQLGLNGTLYE